MCGGSLDFCLLILALTPAFFVFRILSIADVAYVLHFNSIVPLAAMMQILLLSTSGIGILPKR